MFCDVTKLFYLHQGLFSQVLQMCLVFFASDVTKDKRLIIKFLTEKESIPNSRFPENNS